MLQERIDNDEKQQVSWLEVFSIYSANWKWVLLSVALCLGLAVIYLLRTPNTYTQSASLLIKDDSQGGSSGILSDFSSMGLVQTNTTVENEMVTLRSFDLMEEVVKRLDLDYNYYTDGLFHKNVAYGTTLPIEVRLVGMPDKDAAKFNVSVSPAGKVTVSGFTYTAIDTRHKAGADFTGALGDTIHTPFVPILVTATKYRDKSVPIEIHVVKSPLDNTVEAYRKATTVELNNEDATVVDIIITDRSVQRADDVLATIIGVYNENWIEDKNRIAVATSNFINDRLGIIEGDLGNVDADISAYKSSHLVPDIEAAATSYLAQTQQLSDEMLDINNQLQMARYLRTHLVKDNRNDLPLPANAGVANMDLRSQIESYNRLVLERNKIAATSSDRNPLVQSMDQDLTASRHAILTTVDNAIAGLQSQLRGVQGAKGTATSKLASNPRQAKYLLNVERQQKVKESLYLFLLQKREETELSQAFTAYNTRVVNRPGGPTTPTSPKKPIVLLVSILAGLAIPFFWIYISEVSTTTVTTRKDLQGLAAPIMGEIPKAGSRRSPMPKHTVVVRAAQRDPINEAFRVLRTNLEVSRIHKTGCNTVGVTSFTPGVGKSFVTMNLAAAIAISGKKVLVIDADMRHASASQYVGNPKTGLAQYLAGDTDDVHALIVEDAQVRALKVLPVGSMPPNPTELLQSERLDSLMECLKDHYDYVLLDCPPAEIVADVMILDKYVDRTLIVLRSGQTMKSTLPHLAQMYDDHTLHNIAIILNASPLSNHRNRNMGYGLAYGSSYYAAPKG